MVQIQTFCEICLKPFTAGRIDAKVCGSTCQKRKERGTMERVKHRLCPGCGKSHAGVCGRSPGTLRVRDSRIEKGQVCPTCGQVQRLGKFCDKCGAYVRRRKEWTLQGGEKWFVYGLDGEYHVCEETS